MTTPAGQRADDPSTEVTLLPPALRFKTVPPAAALSTCVVDPRGDLWLHTTGSAGILEPPNVPTKFRVCSRTMARSSRVFEKMLFGGFAESKTENGAEWVVQLPDDATITMQPLFELMHSKFDSLERPAGERSQSDLLDKLHSLIVAADKYDCISLLKPFAAQWVKVLTVEHSNEWRLYRLAWIFYQLGCSDSYIEAATRLVVHYPSSGSSCYWYRPLPPNLRENVARIQASMIAVLIAPVRERLDLLVKGGSTPGAVCKAKKQKTVDQAHMQKECEDRILGQLIRDLFTHKLWPIPDTAQIKSSPSALAKVVADLGVVIAAGLFGSAGNHARCREIPAWTDATTTGTEVYSLSYSYTPSSEEIAHMNRQAMLTGMTSLNCGNGQASAQVLFPFKVL
ncbi:hypothetical protein Micbo1qcDRAFT_169280 [Microdochium bolleyi]|uniref:BTB domain-containing protein n=1 Tax=Microdochium bolleyi TaxID=196109 RepID=A0A136IKX6_9PEZI|nr:hypothetical protein Micbo1qcDRAFT_169280 [Microdochium bolleyi]